MNSSFAIRPFAAAPEEMPACAEGACLAWEVLSPEQRFAVKGEWLGPEQLLANESAPRPFRGGPLLLLRVGTRVAARTTGTYP